MRKKLKFQKKDSKKKKIICFVGIILLITIIIIIFSKNNYKISKIGNNVSNKTVQETVDGILNISSYEAEIEVTVKSNKNENKYVLTQKFAIPNICSQEVVEPSNIAGVRITYDGNNMYVKNSNLNLSTIYENYPYLAENNMWLSDFLQKYQKSENKQMSENENEILLEFKEEVSKYNKYQTLYIDKKTAKPTKMIIRDVNNKEVVYILYRKIEINRSNKEKVLA